MSKLQILKDTDGKGRETFFVVERNALGIKKVLGACDTEELANICFDAELEDRRIYGTPSSELIREVEI